MTSTQLVVLRHLKPDPKDPGWYKCHQYYGELHGEHVLIGVDRHILSSTLTKIPTSQEWALYATSRKLTFQTRTGWKSTRITCVPYMLNCKGYIMPVFELEDSDIALDYQCFTKILEPPKPTGPVPAPYVPARATKAVEKPKVAFATASAAAAATSTTGRRRHRSDSTEAVRHYGETIS